MNTFEEIKPLQGTIKFYLDEDEEGCVDMIIPLEKFDSGLDYEDQPVETSFRLESTYLPAESIDELDGKEFSIDQDDNDGSIYIGNAHNPVDIPRISFKRIDKETFEVDCDLFCDFEHEGVGKNQTVNIKTTLKIL